MQHSNVEQLQLHALNRPTHYLHVFLLLSTASLGGPVCLIDTVKTDDGRKSRLFNIDIKMVRLTM